VNGCYMYKYCYQYLVIFESMHVPSEGMFSIKLEEHRYVPGMIFIFEKTTCRIGPMVFMCRLLFVLFLALVNLPFVLLAFLPKNDMKCLRNRIHIPYIHVLYSPYRQKILLTCSLLLHVDFSIITSIVTNHFLWILCSVSDFIHKWAERHVVLWYD